MKSKKKNNDTVTNQIIIHYGGKPSCIGCGDPLEIGVNWHESWRDNFRYRCIPCVHEYDVTRGKELREPKRAQQVAAQVAERRARRLANAAASPATPSPASTADVLDRIRARREKLEHSYEYRANAVLVTGLQDRLQRPHPFNVRPAATRQPERINLVPETATKDKLDAAIADFSAKLEEWKASILVVDAPAEPVMPFPISRIIAGILIFVAGMAVEGLLK